ncbi:ran-binding protein in the microtubule-organising centre protein [Carex rostrata]
MDSAPVNWEALDSLVLSFAKSEHLIQSEETSTTIANPKPSSPPLSPESASSPSTSSSHCSSSSSSFQSRVIIRQIRRCVESGDIDAALEQLRLHIPVVLDDHRILFRLQKQKFIELLRGGTERDRELAIQCLRGALAPCALDAYPEAYEEFKHVLLALIYDKEDESSPVANEWSEKRRFDLAGLLSSILRAHLHAYDPIFSMTLTYLISIHKLFCNRQGIPSPISDLTERLLYEERDAPALPQEMFYEAPPFDEVDIQALAHAVELTRQGSVDSLKFAKGDLLLAFQNELCRMKLDLPSLDRLVHEYCVYRGIVEGCPTSTPDVEMENVQERNADITNKAGLVMETRFANEATNLEREDCSTSDVTNQESGYSSRRLRRSRNHASGVTRRRKRWRGRVENLNCSNNESYTGTSGDATADKDMEITENGNYEMILEMRELAYKGMAEKVVEEINCLDPDFFNQNPVLLFQLKQVEFLKLVSGGDYNGALKVASDHLGPLAASNQALMKPLKETLVALLQPSEDALIKAVPLPVLATSLQVAMGKRLGIEEPQLMRIMRATLHTHTEWFKLQMCKDRFEQLLNIDHLKEVDQFPKRLTDSWSRSLVDDSANNSSSQITTCSSGKVPEEGTSPPVALTGEAACDESAILKVMEFLALPRADAIHLLMQYNNNAETVIQQIFS